MGVSRKLNTPADQPPHTIDRRVGGPQSGPGRFGIDKNIFSPAGNRTPAVQPLAHPYTDGVNPALIKDWNNFDFI
jgi:hypothetical protein